jgi:hypothetical protein
MSDGGELVGGLGAERPELRRFTLHVDFMAVDEQEARSQADAYAEGLNRLRPEVDCYTARISVEGDWSRTTAAFCGASGRMRWMSASTVLGMGVRITGLVVTAGGAMTSCTAAEYSNRAHRTRPHGGHNLVLTLIPPVSGSSDRGRTAIVGGDEGSSGPVSRERRGAPTSRRSFRG